MVKRTSCSVCDRLVPSSAIWLRSRRVCVNCVRELFQTKRYQIESESNIIQQLTASIQSKLDEREPITLREEIRLKQGHLSELEERIEKLEMEVVNDTTRRDNLVERRQHRHSHYQSFKTKLSSQRSQLTPIYESEMDEINQIVVQFHRITTVSLKYLVSKLLKVFQFEKKILSNGDFAWNLCGRRLPSLFCLKETSPQELSYTLSNYLHFLNILSKYLGINLPFKIWYGGDIDSFLIAPFQNGSGSPSGCYPLHFNNSNNSKTSTTHHLPFKTRIELPFMTDQHVYAITMFISNLHFILNTISSPTFTDWKQIIDINILTDKLITALATHLSPQNNPTNPQIHLPQIPFQILFKAILDALQISSHPPSTKPTSIPGLHIDQIELHLQPYITPSHAPDSEIDDILSTFELPNDVVDPLRPDDLEIIYTDMVRLGLLEEMGIVNRDNEKRKGNMERDVILPMQSRNMVEKGEWMVL